MTARADGRTPDDKVREIKAIVNDGNPKLETALKELFSWRPQEGRFPLAAVSAVVTGAGSGYYSGDAFGELREEECPFFTEAFLYSLFGKEDARSLLARLHEVLEAAGLDRHADNEWVNNAYDKYLEEKKRDPRLRGKR
jgi:hypothetical protein